METKSELPLKWAFKPELKHVEALKKIFNKAKYSYTHIGKDENFTKYYWHLTTPLSGSFGRYESSIFKDYEVITSEQFENQFMKFPEKWVVKGSSETVKLISDLKVDGKIFTAFEGNVKDMHYFPIDGGTKINGMHDFPEGYTLVDVEDVRNYYYPKTKEEFPKNWAIKGGTDEFIDIFKKLKEKNILYSSWRGDDIDDYYTSTGAKTSVIPSGYSIVTVEQIQKHYFPEMKQIGWKLKEECGEFERAAAIITYGTNGAKKIGSDILVGSGNERRLSDAGVLKTWFEPVYQQKFNLGDWVVVIDGGNGASGCNGRIGQITDKNMTNGNYSSELKISFTTGQVWGLNKDHHELRLATKEEIQSTQAVTLKLGTGGISIKISKDQIEAEGYAVEVESLSKLATDMNGSSYYKLPWKTYTATVKIGCSTFTRNELLQILKAYDVINSTSYGVELI